MKINLKIANNAALTLKFKVRNPSDRLASFGLFSFQDVVDKILPQYNYEHCVYAVKILLAEGDLNLWYSVPCEVCNHVTHLKETDVMRSEVYNQVIKGLCSCEECKRTLPRFNQEDGSIIRYEIPQKYLTKVEENSAKAVGFFSRLLKKLKLR